MKLIEIVEGNQNVSLDQLKDNEELVLEIQVKRKENLTQEWLRK
jgi:hypothetical protein